MEYIPIEETGLAKMQKTDWYDQASDTEEIYGDTLEHFAGTL